MNEKLEQLTLDQLLELLPEEISRESKNGYDNNRPTIYKKDNKQGTKYSIRCYYWGYYDERQLDCKGRELLAKGRNLKEAIINFLVELERIEKFNDHLLYRRIKL